MIEKIFFYVIAIALFVIIFLKMMRKNEITYLVSLVLQAIGILISLVGLIFTLQINIFLKAVIYIISIGLPIAILVCESKKINLTELIYIGIAKSLLFFKEQKQAKKLLLALVEKYPDSKVAHKMLADIYEKEGGIRRAIDEYVKVVDLDGESYDAYYKIAVLLKELGNKEDSLEMLTKLVNKEPDYLEAAISLSDALCEQERYKEAISVMNESLRHHPNNFDVYYNMGMIYTMLNDFSSAKECYEKAAIINSLEYNTKFNIAMIELILGELDEAEAYFNQCLEDEDLSPLAYYELAKIYMIRGDKETASQHLNLAIELDNHLYKKAMEEELFNPIKGYINYPAIDEEDMEPREYKLSEKELKIKEHFEQTYKLVGKLNYREIGSRYNHNNEDKKIEMQREQ